MTEISFGEAMLAVEQGKSVQYRYIGETFWSNLLDDNCLNISSARGLKWRIKPEPIKYSVDVWLESKPAICANAKTLGQYLVGENNYWLLMAGQYYKHYRITVKEVEAME